jgi:plasmid stability protein
MVKLTLRLPEELHAKLRWLAYKQHRSQQGIVLDLLKKSLQKVKVPKGARR